MFKLEDLSQIERVSIRRNFDSEISIVAQLSQTQHSPQSITWCSDKNINAIACLNNTNIIVSEAISPDLLKSSCNYVVCANPRLLFMKLITTYFNEPEGYLIAPSAKVDASVILGKNVALGENVVIEKNCIIGDNVRIDHNSVIKRNTLIGSHVSIGANCTIGGCGLGYEKDNHGNYQLIPHIGNVILHDYVEVGQNNCIDRAVLGSTILYEYVKTDNHVHIAHGVTIGKNSILTAHAVIAGSTNLGENVWIGPGSLIMNKVNLGNNVFTGLGAVVLKSVEDNSIMVGNPAKLLKKV